MQTTYIKFSESGFRNCAVHYNTWQELCSHIRAYSSSLAENKLNNISLYYMLTNIMSNDRFQRNFFMYSFQNKCLMNFQDVNLRKMSKKSLIHFSFIRNYKDRIFNSLFSIKWPPTRSSDYVFRTAFYSGVI